MPNRNSIAITKGVNFTYVTLETTVKLYDILIENSSLRYTRCVNSKPVETFPTTPNTKRLLDFFWQYKDEILKLAGSQDNGSEEAKALYWKLKEAAEAEERKAYNLEN